MNKRNKERKRETERRKKVKLMHQKKAEKETEKMQHEINKLSNQNCHIVKETSEKERNRIALSMLPKEKNVIENIRKYRQERRKKLEAKNGKHG